MAKKNPFATDKENKLYVRVDCVMTPLVALIDCLTLVFFGKGKTAYLKVDDAIEWCRAEMKYHGAERYSVMIAAMEKAKAQVAKEASLNPKGTT